MALTIGSGPFGSSPAGSFNFDPDAPEAVLYLEPSHRRARAVFAGKEVAASDREHLVG